MTIKDFKKELEKYDENVIIEGIADGPICDFSNVGFRFFHCWDENNREILTIWVEDID